MGFPGRSVQFFMTESDEKEFLDFVKSTGDVLFFDRISRTAEFRPVVNLPVPDGPLSGGHFFMVNRSVPSRFITNPPSQFKLDDKDCYGIDNIESSVVGFHRCYREPGCVFEGDLGMVTSYLASDDVTLVSKDPKFLKWFDKMARWIRKRYVKLVCMTFIRVGPEAGRLFEEGSLDLVLARNPVQEIVVEGSLLENRQLVRNRKGVLPAVPTTAELTF
jgi:hypothetical protein